MPTAKKAAVIEELAEKLNRINAAALVDYRGLTVAEIGALRGQLRPRDVELQVTKNTLLREAARRNNMHDLDDLFEGPTAVAFIYGEEPPATKALNDFFRTARVGEVKAGILKGGRRVTAAQFATMADLPGRQALLGQIAGLLTSPLATLAALFNAPAQEFAYALAAFEEKGGSGRAAAEPAPAAEAPAGPSGQAGAAVAPDSDITAAGVTADSAATEQEAVAQPADVAAAPPAVDEAPAGPAAGPTTRVEEPAAVAAEESAVTEQPVVASDTAADPSSAPESEGSAAAEPTGAPEPGTGDSPAASEVAADVSAAPESEGSADARPSV